MTEAALPPEWRHDTLRPRSADSAGTGLALSLVTHAGLVAALSLGVQWRSQEASPVQAELWAAVPQIAAPPAPAGEPLIEPVAPPPAPARQPVAENTSAAREADIALAKAQEARASEAEAARLLREKQRLKEAQIRKELAEKERARVERERAEQAEQDKARKAKESREAEQRKFDKAAEAKRLAAEEARDKKGREDQLRRMSAQLGGAPSATPGQAVGNGPAGSTGTAARSAGPAANGDYAGRIVARIKPNIVLTDAIPGNPEAIVEVRVGPDGRILGRRLVQPSGNATWDEAVLRAVDRTDMVPRKTDGTVEPRLEIRFKPRD